MSLILLIGYIHLGMLLIFVSNLIYLKRQRPAAVGDPPLKVSVLIPARNESENLKRLLPSLLAQTYPQVEFIVYNDQSTDDTWSILNSFNDGRLTLIDGGDVPRGWVGKVHGLYEASRLATGDVYLFLDADAEFNDPDALSRLIGRFAGLPEDSVLTGLPKYEGGGLLLVSLTTNVLLVTIPWMLVRPLRISSLSALNGQCWMLRAEHYRLLEPHREVAGEILEDVLIGRYLKKSGIIPVLVDVQRELRVHMYEHLEDAWRGFRKNVYLLLGQNLPVFLILFSAYCTIFVAAPSVSPWLLLSLYAIKASTDQKCGLPAQISILAPFSYLLGSILQIDSAWHHLTGRVEWKGRTVQKS